MINKSLKKIALGAAALLSVGGATLASTSAEAYPWHGGYGGYGGYHGGYGGYGWRGGGFPVGAAIGAGLFGLAVGASLDHPYYGPAYGAYGCGGWRWSPRFGRYVYLHGC